MIVSKLIELLQRQDADKEVLYANYEEKSFEDREGNLIVYSLVGVEAVELENNTPAVVIYTAYETVIK